MARKGWRGDGGVFWGDWKFQTLLIKPIQTILSCFSDPVSEFPLTYHCELIDEDSGTFRIGGGDIALNIPSTATDSLHVYTRHDPNYTAIHMAYYVIPLGLERRSS